MLSFPGSIGALPDAVYRKIFSIKPIDKPLIGDVYEIERLPFLPEDADTSSESYSHSSNVYARLLAQMCFRPMISIVIDSTDANSDEFDVDRIAKLCYDRLLVSCGDQSVQTRFVFTSYRMCQIVFQSIDEYINESVGPLNQPDVFIPLDTALRKFNELFPSARNNPTDNYYASWNIPPVLSNDVLNPSNVGLNGMDRNAMVEAIRLTLEYQYTFNDPQNQQETDQATEWIKKHLDPTENLWSSRNTTRPLMVEDWDRFQHLLGTLDLAVTGNYIPTLDTPGTTYHIPNGKVISPQNISDRALIGETKEILGFFGGFATDRTAMVKNIERYVSETMAKSDQHTLDENGSGLKKYERVFSSIMADRAWRKTKDDSDNLFWRNQMDVSQKIEDMSLKHSSKSPFDGEFGTLCDQFISSPTTWTDRTDEQSRNSDLGVPANITHVVHTHDKLATWRGSAHYALWTFCGAIAMVSSCIHVQTKINSTEFKQVLDKANRVSLSDAQKTIWKEALVHSSLRKIYDTYKEVTENIHTTLFSMNGTKTGQANMSADGDNLYAENIVSKEIYDRSNRFSTLASNTIDFTNNGGAFRYNGPVTEFDIDLFSVYLVQLIRDRSFLQGHLGIVDKRIDNDISLVNMFIRYMVLTHKGKMWTQLIELYNGGTPISHKNLVERMYSSLYQNVAMTTTYFNANQNAIDMEPQTIAIRSQMGNLMVYAYPLLRGGWHAKDANLIVPVISDKDLGGYILTSIQLLANDRELNELSMKRDQRNAIEKLGIVPVNIDGRTNEELLQDTILVMEAPPSVWLSVFFDPKNGDHRNNLRNFLIQFANPQTNNNIAMAKRVSWFNHGETASIDSGTGRVMMMATKGFSESFWSSFIPLFMSHGAATRMPGRLFQTVVDHTGDVDKPRVTQISSWSSAWQSNLKMIARIIEGDRVLHWNTSTAIARSNASQEIINDPKMDAVSNEEIPLSPRTRLNMLLNEKKGINVQAIVHAFDTYVHDSETLPSRILVCQWFVQQKPVGDPSIMQLDVYPSHFSSNLNIVFGGFNQTPQSPREKWKRIQRMSTLEPIQIEAQISVYKRTARSRRFAHISPKSMLISDLEPDSSISPFTMLYITHVHPAVSTVNAISVSVNS